LIIGLDRWGLFVSAHIVTSSVGVAAAGEQGRALRSFVEDGWAD